MNDRIQTLLGLLTLEEKVAQLTAGGRWTEIADDLTGVDGRLDGDSLAERFPHGIGQIGRPSQKSDPAASAELANRLQQALSRRGIGLLFNEEGVHGLMATGATSFPSAIALASTWNPGLVEEVYTVVARETRARGSNYVYAPVLDLARDPRWGRVEETFGEDPFLVSRLGVAAVHGLQGRDHRIGPDRVLACAKHYAAHGQPQSGMNAGPVSVGERQLREEHLAPFQAAVEAGVGAVMAAYHDIDGIPVHTSQWLLDQILRKEWAFDGIVTSDGYGIPQLVSVHQVAQTEGEAGRMALEAGVDCEVPAPVCFPHLVDLVQDGSLSMDRLDEAVARVLAVKDRLGLLDGLPAVDPGRASALANHPDHRALALESARQGIVLLSNDGVLPLDLDRLDSIAVIGPLAADLHLGGYAEDPGTGTSILDGIRARFGPHVDIEHAEGCRITEGTGGPAAWWRDEVTLADPDDDDERIAAAVAIAESADLAIVAVGDNEGTCREGWWFDHLGDRDSLELLGRQVELIERVAATGTPVVAVIMGGRPLDVSPVLEHAGATLLGWYPGQEGGTALAEILAGDVNPGGKLPITFPRSVGQIPRYAARKPSDGRGYLFASHEPLLPFGHGLSYTTFEYRELRVDPSSIAADGKAEVTVGVANTGTMPGTEIVQLYVHDRVASVTRPLRVLRGFERVALAPGEERLVRFSLNPPDLALLNREMRRVVEPGVFEIYVGGSSDAELSVELTVHREVMTAPPPTGSR